MCINNYHLKDKVPRGNGTICRVLIIKLKQDAPSYKWKNYYGRKVWTVNATHVEYVECKHVNKTGRMLQLETNINNLTIQLNQRDQITRTESYTIQNNIGRMKTTWLTIMNKRKFKLKTEQCSPKNINQTIHQFNQKY